MLPNLSVIPNQSLQNWPFKRALWNEGFQRLHLIDTLGPHDLLHRVFVGVKQHVLLWKAHPHHLIPPKLLFWRVNQTNNWQYKESNIGQSETWKRTYWHTIWHANKGHTLTACYNTGYMTTLFLHYFNTISISSWPQFSERFTLIELMLHLCVGKRLNRIEKAAKMLILQSFRLWRVHSYALTPLKCILLRVL